jgi:hypothetical protein
MEAGEEEAAEIERGSAPEEIGGVPCLLDVGYQEDERRTRSRLGVSRTEREGSGNFEALMTS